MRTQYYTATSIDGFIADSDNSLEWLFGAGEGDSDAAGMRDEYPRFIAEVGALAMGSTTYAWVLEHLGVLDDPSAWPYKQPTWVFSSRPLPYIAGADVRLVSGDVTPVHADMVEAAGGKNIWLVGGGDLVGQFYDRGLLDEITLGMAPVFLGSGAPLLPRRIVWPTLTLLEASQYGSTFVTLRYSVTYNR
jgi:dihydrofolate reductase